MTPNERRQPPPVLAALVDVVRARMVASGVTGIEWLSIIALFAGLWTIRAAWEKSDREQWDADVEQAIAVTRDEGGH